MKKAYLFFIIVLCSFYSLAQSCVTIQIDTLSDPYCPASFQGSLQATVSGGSGNYTYFWLDSLGNNPNGLPVNSLTLSNLNLHKYWFYVTDNVQNCTDSAFATFLDYTCLNDTASVNVTTPFDFNPVNYDQFSSCQVTITNEGCEIDLRPEFTISHNSPIQQGSILIEAFNNVNSTWENLSYSIVNGQAVGYWGDSDGESLNCDQMQSKNVRVKFNQFAPVAHLGEYTADLRLWKVNNNGDLLSVISEVETVSIVLQDTICNDFVLSSSITDASCFNQADGEIELNSTGGLLPIEYSLNDPNSYSSNSIFSSLAPGQYISYIKDGNDCIVSDTLMLGPPDLEPDSLWFTNINLSSAEINWNYNSLVDGYRFRYSINNASDWTVVISPGGYDDGLSNPNTSKLINGLIGDTIYEVQIKTNSLIDNCEQGWSTSFYFETPAETFVFDVDSSCTGGDNGSISLSLDAVSSGYLFNWIGPNNFSSTDTSIFDLEPGDYNLEVLNSLSVIILDTTISIGESMPEVISMSINDQSNLVVNTAGQSYVNICNSNSYLHSTDSNFTNYSWTNGFMGQNLLLDTIANGSTVQLTALDTNGCTVMSNVVNLTIVTDFVNFEIANQNQEVISSNYLFCSSDSSLVLDISDYTTGEFFIQWNEVVNSNFNLLGAEDTVELFPQGNTNYVLEIFNCSYGFSITYEESISLETQIFDNLCYGDEQGSIIVDIDSPSPEFNVGTYNQSDSLVFFANSLNFIDTIGSLSSGEYTLVVTDTTVLCSYNQEFFIDQPDSLYIDSLQLSLINCSSDEYASLQFNVVGGVPPYQFTLNGQAVDIQQNPDNLSFLLDSLLPMSYTLGLLDSNNCIAQNFNFSVPALDTLQLNISNYSYVNCFGDSGFVELQANGGTMNYNFELYSQGNLLASQPQTLFDSLLSGEYMAIVTDFYNCTDTVNFAIESNDELIIEEDFQMHQNISCYGANDGSFTVDVTGGLQPYSVIALSDTIYNSTVVYDSLQQGEVIVTVIDSFGCESETSITITEPDLFFVDTLMISNIECDDLYGSVSFLNFGGVPAYSYSLNGENVSVSSFPDSTVLIDELEDDNYELIISDENGCADTSYFAILEIPYSLAMSITNATDTINCYGDDSGEINVQVTGGVAPYIYSLSLNGQEIISDTSSGNFENLIAGSYSVTIFDTSECFVIQDTIIYQQEQLIVSEEHDNVSCNGFSDGSFELLIEGGSQPYFALNNQTGVVLDSTDYFNLSSQLIDLTIYDFFGCSDSIEINITEPDTFFISEFLTKDIFCEDTVSLFSFEQNGGIFPFVYEINGQLETPIIDGSTFEFENFDQGNYFLTISDSSQCTDTVSFSITDYRISYDLLLSSTPDTILCFGDSTGVIEVNATGGMPPYQYSLVFDSDTLITQQTTIFSNLPAGDYEIISVDSNQCIETLLVSLHQNTEVIVSDSISLHRDLSCFGINDGSFTLSVNGGVPSYTINMVDSVAFSHPHSYNNLAAGMYDLIISDNVGCQKEIEITIEEPDSLYFESFQIQDVLCFGDSSGELNYTVSGGTAPYYYMLDSDSLQSLNQLYQGDFTIEIVDINGCSIDSIFSVAQPQPLTLDVVDSLSNNISCVGGQNGLIRLSASGGTLPYSYQLENGNLQNQNFFNNLSSGNYTLSVVDSNNCSFDVTYSLAEPSQPFYISNYTLSDTLGYCVLCYGDTLGSINLEVSGGTGNSFDFYTLSEPNQPSDNIFTNLIGGTVYEFYSIDSLGCSSDTISVNCNSTVQIELNVLNIVDPICCYSCDGEATILASGGTQPYKYSFNGGDFQTSNYNNTICPNYNEIIVRDFNQCTYFDSILVEVENCLMIDTVNYTNGSEPAVLDYDSCKTENSASIFVKAFNGVAPYQIAIDDQEYSSVAQGYFDQLSSGIHFLKVIDDVGCKDSMLVNIADPDPLKIQNLTIDSLFCSYPSVNEITNLSEYGSFTLEIIGGTPSQFGYQMSIDQLDSSSFSYNNSFYNLSSGIYSVNVLDSLNCSFEYDVEVNGFYSSLDYSITPISCTDFDDGILEINSYNGNLSFTEFDGNLFTNSTVENISFGQHVLSSQFLYPTNNTEVCINYDTLFFDHTDTISYDLTVIPNYCFGECDGSISISNIDGGVAPYSTLCLNNADTSSIISNLCADNYAIRVTDSLGCYTITQVEVTQPNVIYPIIVQNNQTLQVISPTEDNPNEGVPPFDYQWYDENGLIEGASGSEFTLEKTGRYYVVVTDSNDCQGISAEFEVSTIDISTLETVNYRVFPNPVSDVLNIETDTYSELSWSISDVVGNLIKKGKVNKSTQIDINRLANGTYVLTIFNGKKETDYKIIKY